MKPDWIIQVTLISMEDSNGLHDAITDQQMHCEPIYMVPFMDELPEDFEPPQPENTLFYGSTKLIKLCSEHPVYNKGVWYDDDLFQYNYHIELNGEQMLNHDARVTPLAKAAQVADEYDLSEPSVGRGFFCRPLGDLKQFSGEYVKDTGDLYQWQEKLKMAGMYDFLDTPVLVAKAKTIVDEYRCFVVSGQISAAAKYIDKGHRKDTPVTGKELAELTDYLEDIVMPMEACVCDVAWTGEDFKVIEFNCINGSGFYGHDLSAIVRDLSEIGVRK